MKQVESNKYDREYYIKAYGQSDFLEEEGYFLAMHNLIYQEIAKFAGVKNGDSVVDYGCGNGDLAFYLASKFCCNVKAADYSKEAIDICNEKLKKIGGLDFKIEFFNGAADSLPDFKNIKIVFFCDVFEHMYDEEIKIVLKQAQKWGSGGKIKIAIHTDNNNYLRFINPIFNLINLFLRNKSLDQIRKEKKIEKELHINLTTPGKLKNKMEKWGYKQIALAYPCPVESRIEKQLGKLQNVPYFSKICAFILKKLDFLSPSFYAVFESNGK